MTGGLARYYYELWYTGGVLGFESDHFYCGEVDTSGYGTCGFRSNSAIDFTEYRYWTYFGRSGSQNLYLCEDIMITTTSADVLNVTKTIDISGINGYHYLYERAFSGAWSHHTAIFRVYEITLIK